MGNNKPPAWRDEKLNVLIPMAGAGSDLNKLVIHFQTPY
jgi:hypothetical protein